MKNSIMIGLFVLLMASAYAGFFDIMEYRDLPTDFTAEKERVQDIDQNFCAALRIETVGNFEVTLKEKIYKTATIGGNKYIFFSASLPNLTLQSQGTEPYYMGPTDRHGFQAGKVYFLRTGIKPEADLTIFVEPEDALIMIDGRIWSGPTESIAPGVYTIHITKEGYEEILDAIHIREPIVNITYELTSADIEHEVVIIVNPADAQIIVNGVPWASNINHLRPGSHFLEIRKQGYNPISETIEVRSNNVSFRYELTATGSNNPSK